MKAMLVNLVRLQTYELEIQIELSLQKETT